MCLLQKLQNSIKWSSSRCDFERTTQASAQRIPSPGRFAQPPSIRPTRPHALQATHKPTHTRTHSTAQGFWSCSELVDPPLLGHGTQPLLIFAIRPVRPSSDSPCEGTGTALLGGARIQKPIFLCSASAAGVVYSSYDNTHVYII